MDPVASHAKERPDAPALIFGDRTVTWGELDRRGNQTARALRKRGVGPGDRISVSLRNSIEFFEIIVAVRFTRLPQPATSSELLRWMNSAHVKAESEVSGPAAQMK